MLQSLKLQSHIGQDGILRLELPLDVANTDVEMVIVFQPMPPKHQPSKILGWPSGFFSKTFGSFKDDPLERPPQGKFETRNELE